MRKPLTREQVLVSEDQRELWDLLDPESGLREMWHQVDLLMADLDGMELWRRIFRGIGLVEVHQSWEPKDGHIRWKTVSDFQEPTVPLGPCVSYRLCPDCRTSRIIQSLLPPVVRPPPAPKPKDPQVQVLEEELAKHRKALSDRVDLSLDSDMFAGGFGNRLAPAQYRNGVVATFLQHMQRLGDVALVDKKQALVFLRGPILADIESMWAAAEATPEEGERRAQVEWLLKNPSTAEVLVGTEEYNEDERREFAALVLVSGVDTSVQELTRRSAELGAGEKRDGG